MIRIRILLVLLFSWSIAFAQKTDASLEPGKKLFRVHCSRCHGMLGAGGTGPSLKRPYLPRASSDEKLAYVIANGIEGTGMPFNWMLAGEDVQNLVKYVRHLGEGTAEGFAGDPENGKILFANSICSTCHVVSGEGGSIGPELTEIGLKRGPEYMIEAITHPGKTKPVDENGFYQFLVVQVTRKDGSTVEGIRLNEDTFTIQLKDAGNNFYSFSKSEIKAVEKVREESLMPSFAEQFNSQDIHDLVAYLTTLK